MRGFEIVDIQIQNFKRISKRVLLTQFMTTVPAQHGSSGLGTYGNSFSGQLFTKGRFSGSWSSGNDGNISGGQNHPNSVSTPIVCSSPSKPV